MGVLKTVNGSQVIYLKPVHVFGRDPNVADYLLTNQSCSRMHCVIRWQGNHWGLVDESTNGCLVNGELVEKGLSVRLFKGDTVTIAGDETSKWRMYDEAPAKPVLVRLDGGDFIELTNLNILPSEKQPECQIFNSADAWVYESNQDSHLISEGSQVDISGQRWVFYPNQNLDKTVFKERAISDDLAADFSVSRSEEHVHISVFFGGRSYDLGHKTYHYLLLEMARYQLEDDIDNIKEKGWINNDLLLHNLKIDVNHLNIQIYRTRKAVSKISKRLSETFIERRRGEIRLKPCKITINQR